ncbi:MAG: tetratricopeptide repeat protein [Acidobacteriota bacterium]
MTSSHPQSIERATRFGWHVRVQGHFVTLASSLDAGRLMRTSLPRATFVLLVACLPLALACGDDPHPPLDLAPLPTIETEALAPAVVSELERRRAAIEELGAAEPAARARLHGELGQVLHAHELLDAAVVAYGNAEVLAEADPRWPYLAGLALHGAGDFAGARSALERAIDRADTASTPIAVGHFALGRTLQTLGELDQARAALERALAIDPTLALAHFHLGQIEEVDGDLEAAIARYRRVLDLQPTATAVEVPLAAALHTFGDAEQASIHLARRGDGAIRLDDPWMAEVQARAEGASTAVDRGARAFGQGRFNEAAGWFRRAVEQAPDDATARLNLASALARLGEREAARAELLLAAELDPTEPRVHFNLGALAAGDGAVDEAAASYRRALDLDERYASAWFNLANLHLRAGSFVEAIPAFERAVALDPTNRSARLGQLVALDAGGRAAEALDAAERHRAALPADPQLVEAQARLLAASSDPALRDGAAAQQLLESLSGPQMQLGMVEATAMAMAASGDFAAAVAAQQQALDAVRSSRRQDLVAEMEADLERYRRGEPPDRAWNASAFGADWSETAESSTRR